MLKNTNTNTNIKGKEFTMSSYKFFLIIVMDREITAFRFRTRDEARNEMRRQFIEAGGDIEENNDYASLNEDSAWVNDGDNHSDFDWRVVEVNEIPIFS